MQKLYEDIGVCPVCLQKSFRLTFYIKNIPPEGPSVLSVGICSNCGHRDVKIYPIEGRGKKKLAFRYPDHERIIIYLPPNTEIKIPEADLELLLTGNFGGKITTIEGIIEMIKEMGADVKTPCTVLLENEDGMLRTIELRTPSTSSHNH